MARIYLRTTFRSGIGLAGSLWEPQMAVRVVTAQAIDGAPMLATARIADRLLRTDGNLPRIATTVVGMLRCFPTMVVRVRPRFPDGRHPARAHGQNSCLGRRRLGGTRLVHISGRQLSGAQPARDMARTGETA